MIRKLASGGYRLYSRKINPKTGRRRNLGTFKTRAAALKHERAIQFFKRGGSPWRDERRQLGAISRKQPKRRAGSARLSICRRKRGGRWGKRRRRQPRGRRVRQRCSGLLRSQSSSHSARSLLNHSRWARS